MGLQTWYIGPRTWYMGPCIWERLFVFQSMYLVFGRGYTVVGSVYHLYQRSLFQSLMVPERIGNSANVLKPGKK